MSTLNKTRWPIKTIHDKRLAYLASLETGYKELGYVTKLDGRDNILYVYPAGTVIVKTQEETLIEKWTC